MPIPQTLQMPKTRNCGQVAIANLTGCSLQEAEWAVGHSTGTKTVEIVNALRKLGYECSGKLVPLHQHEDGKLNNGKPIPANGIVKLARGKSKRWHWIAVKDGEFLDGARPTLKWEDHERVTSYMAVSL